MNKSPDEIIKKHYKLYPYMDLDEKEQIQEAMYEYGKQEAFSFAHWLSHEPINGRTTVKLWNDYQDSFK